RSVRFGLGGGGLVEHGQRDRHRLLGARDHRLVGLDLLVGAQHLLLVARVLVLDRLDLAAQLGDPLVALGDRGGVGAQLGVAVGDGLDRGGELGVGALLGVARRRQAAAELVALVRDLADLAGVLGGELLALALVLAMGGAERALVL